VALGAAHAFKFASLFGKILSELAIDGATACDISTFNIDRPILREERPAQSFMI
jgi:sarcosine oxidase